MSYQYNLVVMKTSAMEWTIFSDKGHTLHVLTRCMDKNEAEIRAKAWASTWNSVGIKVLDAEQD